jgi:hypothetical protein
MVPALTTSFAFRGLSNSLPNISATNIHRRGTIEQDIDALPALSAAENGVNVGKVPRPHFSSVMY